MADGRLNVGVHLPLLGRRYRYLNTLGEGVSAQVLLVEDTLRPGHLVTIKVMRRQNTYLGHREARTLRYLHSRRAGGEPAPGVVRLLGSFMLGAHFCMVMEQLYPRLLDWVVESVTMSRQANLHALRKLAHQLLVSVAFLHEHGVVHADIKPDNILMRSPPGSPSMGISLVDLGGAYSKTETDMDKLVAEVQTLPYRAPEVALGCPAGAVVDEWSVGVVLAETALKRPLFPASNPMELLQLMALELGPLPAEVVSSSQWQLGQQYDFTALVMPPPGNPCTHEGRGISAGTLEALLGPVAAGENPPQCNIGPVHRDLQQIDPLLADLIKGLLQYNPLKRATAKMSLLHPFFAELTPFCDIFPELRVPHADTRARKVVEYNMLGGGASDLVRPHNILRQPHTAEVQTEASHDRSQIEREAAYPVYEDHAASAVASGGALPAPISLAHPSNAPSSSQGQDQEKRRRTPSEQPKSSDDAAAKRQRRDSGRAASTEKSKPKAKPWWMV